MNITPSHPAISLSRPDDHGHEDGHAEGLAVDLPVFLGTARPAVSPSIAATTALELAASAATSVAVPSLASTGAVHVGRRQFLRLAGGAGAVAVLAACGSSGASDSTTSVTDATTPDTTAANGASTTAASSAGTAAEASAGAEIPDETAGPYPGDGTNGPNALVESGVVRQDIRQSFGSSSGVAEGIETVVRMTVVDADTGTALPGAAVYLWHATRDGKYSLYDLPDENYLRGVQVADDTGTVAFTSVFPGCYAGRWPHAHFEVYSSIDEATVGSQAIKTSQLACPEAACTEAYAVSGYESSIPNLANVTLASDNVFSDGYDDQLAVATGNPTDGYTMSLLVRV